MRARELRDVIEVLILPSLERALNELNKPRGSRRRARLLVQQSVDQLFGMMVVDKKPVMPPVLKPGERLPLDRLDELAGQPPLGQLQQRDAGARVDPVALNTGGEPAGRLEGSNDRQIWTNVDEVVDGYKYYRRTGDPDRVVLHGDPALQEDEPADPRRSSRAAARRSTTAPIR